MSLRNTRSEKEIIVTIPFLPFSSSASFLRRLRAVAGSLCVFVAACGGGADAPPPEEGAPAAVAPVITQQPADLTVLSGQPASFTVAATGTAPLAFQWQHNGTAIAGATAATYSVAAAAPADTGAVFSAVVSNVAGTATSNNAVLTVTTAPPVLTITQQPANQAVTAGASATFTVAATCSAGTLAIQWERASESGFAAIAGATALTYTLTTAAADNGAQFRATLSCGGLSTTSSSVASLGVGAPGGITVSLLNITNRAAQAGVSQLGGVDRLPDGTTVYTSGNNVIKLSADQENIAVIAGDQGTAGNTDGQGAAARFRTPSGVVHDASGNLWVVDAGNRAIRRIAPDGTVTTVATLPAGSVVTSIAIGPDGDFYLGDQNGGVIRRMTSAGVVSVYAGSGNYGLTDGLPSTADIGEVRGIAIASNGDVYFSERNSGRIRRVVRSGTVAGNVETIAGNGDGTTTPGLDGVGTAAGIPQPSGLAIAGSTLYVRDFTLIRAIDLTTFAVSTFSGNRVTPTGLKDGPATESGFPNLNRGVLTAISGGGLMLGDGVAIRAVDAAGTVKTISSANNQVIAPGGTAVTDRLPFAAGGVPVSLAVDGQHRVVVGTDLLALVRRIDTAGNLEILAGNPAGATLPIDGVGSAAALSIPGRAIAASADGTVYFSDNSSVRRIALDRTVTTIAGSFPASGTTVDGPTGTSGTAIPSSLVVGIDGSVYFTEGRPVIRRIDAAGNTTTFAGSPNNPGTADGPLASATFAGTGALVSAPDGTIYVADGQTIRKITPAGIVSTLRSGVLVSAMALDPSTGLLYVTFVNGDGISVVDPVSGASSVVIRSGTGLVVGNVEPRVGAMRALAMLGPKQLVICTDVDKLAVVTLP